MNGIISEDVSCAYGKTQILFGLSFHAKKGEITYLAGENGVGKTTWIKVATNLKKATSGQVTYGGKRFSRVQDEFAIVFDIPAVYPKLTGYDNLKILYNVKGRAPDNASLLNELGFDSRMLRMKAGEYSLGQRHRFAIAAALLRKPKFLILDEPDIGLDPKSWTIVVEKLLDLKSQGCAIIITGQNFDSLEKISDHIVILSQGKAKYNGSIQALKKQYQSDNITLKEIFQKIVNGD